TKSQKTRSVLPRSRWTKCTLSLEPLENRALPNSTTQIATFTHLTNYSNRALAPTITQFDTLGGIRTLTSVEIISTIEVDSAVTGSVTNDSGAPATYHATVTNASISLTGDGFTTPLTATQASLLDTGAVSCPDGATTPITGFAASV